MPGLYAVGDNAGSHTTESGGAGALGWAVVTVYMAGIEAGKYIKNLS